MIQGRYGQNIPRLSKSPYCRKHSSTATPVHAVGRQHVLYVVKNAFAFISTKKKTSRQNDDRACMKQGRRPQQNAIAHCQQRIARILRNDTAHTCKASHRSYCPINVLLSRCLKGDTIRFDVLHTYGNAKEFKRRESDAQTNSKPYLYTGPQTASNSCSRHEARASEEREAI